jgi:hypothetical protein
MSIAIALKKDDTIYFGVDSQTTYGVFKTNKLNEESRKILILPNDFIIASAGLKRGTIYFRSHPEWFDLTKDQPLKKIYCKSNHQFII